MSRNIWTALEGSKRARKKSGQFFRVVEYQFEDPIFNITKTLSDRNLLRDIIDEQQPSLPDDHKNREELILAPFRRFRRSPGARFDGVGSRSILYGSEEVKTALTEFAYHRARFYKASEAFKEGKEVGYSACILSIQYECSKFLNLTTKSFQKFKKKLADPDSYDFAQKVGAEMRKNGVEGFSSYSARDIGGINYGFFTPNVLRLKRPLKPMVVYINDQTVRFTGQPELENIEFLVKDLL